MKARLAGSVCPICLKGIEVGEEIEKFMGRWIHSSCASAEGRTTVPENWKWRGQRITQGGKSANRRGTTRGNRPVA